MQFLKAPALLKRGRASGAARVWSRFVEFALLCACAIILVVWVGLLAWMIGWAVGLV
jgi:Flp pilus assembly protein TadB